MMRSQKRDTFHTDLCSFSLGSYSGTPLLFVCESHDKFQAESSKMECKKWESSYLEVEVGKDEQGQIGMEENRDNVSVQERTFDRNFRRHARYAQIQKRAESKRQKILHQSNSTAALTINTFSLSPQQGQLTIFLSSFCRISLLNIYSYIEASEPTNLPVTSTRGERIVICLSTFEVGSTSTTSHVASKLSSRRTANRGRNKLEVNLQNANLLPKDYLLLKKVPNCKFCAAKRLQYESLGFCCDNGSIRLTSHYMPTELRNLFLGDSKECQHFRTYSRAYNNMFAFTSLGVHYDRELAKRNHGIYTFKVQGQMYHFIDDLIPSAGKGKNLQLYFYDNENELTNRMTLSDNLNELIVIKLIDILKHNPYSTFLRSLAVVPNLSEFYIALNSSFNLDQRTHNLPTASEVGVIWIEDQLNDQILTPHIRIYTHSNRSQLVNYYYGCYDPLQYPLLFPYGQNG
ncbi:hypothetical protein H5410_032102 [Solanum commersonii]|uniref:Helitron helicase-like domain-containing protein n=1 Tax=Solanum commersonii TaxID=4109 RepID=A0A9J5YNN9_SOLCO|nr:hypothetical protein H5410_032102 [Solanum commersonii]